jgi:ABC-type transporter Mla subunit MlaD
MGMDIGEITDLIPNNPYDPYNITVRFRVKVNANDYPGYIWSDSHVKVNSGLLGGRSLEVTKGVAGVPTVFESPNKTAIGMLNRDYLQQRFRQLAAHRTNEPAPDTITVLHRLNADAATNRDAFYGKFTGDSIYWLEPAESPSVNERLEQVVSQVERALPNILELTNRIATVLADTSQVGTNASLLMSTLLPTATNLAVITENLRDPHGSFGEWLLPTNINQQLEGTLTGANTNLPLIAEDLGRMIENLASMTSNLNAQVQANSNILGSISQAVTDTDDLVQGLKRHWLLRSAFKKKK